MSGGGSMSVGLPNGLLMGGATLLLLDYLDRQFLISKDLGLLMRVGLITREMESLVKNEITLADFWEQKWHKNPHKVCIVFEGQSFTFADVEKNINRMAHFLISKGIKKGDVVAVLMENRPQFIFTWMALSKIGAIAALLNANQKGVALWRSIQVSTAKTIVFGWEMNEQVEKIMEDVQKKQIQMFCEGGPSPYGIDITSLLLNFPSSAPDKLVRKGLTSTDIWGFIFTSGTTGYPKASVIRHLRFFILACSFAQEFGVRNSDRIYASLPLYHAVSGILGVGMMIYTNSTLVLRRKFSAKHFWRDIVEWECTVFLYSGELCRYLVSLPESPLDRQHKIRLAIGNGLRPDIWEQFQTRFDIEEIGEFYGSTEGNVALGHIVKQDGQGRGAVGRIGLLGRMSKGRIIVQYDREKDELIRDANGFCIECKPGQPGELLGRIRKTFTEFAGYYGNKEGTSEKIVMDVLEKGDVYYRTGDLLKRDAKGYFYFIDRIGDNYRWKGVNISTNEVAEALTSFTEVQEANVYGIQLPKVEGRVGMAAIVPKEGMEIDMAAFARHACRELPSYSVPVFIRLMPEMPLTDSLKHRKVDLRKEAINIHVVTDPIYVLNPKKLVYERLTEAKFWEIMFGKVRL